MKKYFLIFPIFIFGIALIAIPVSKIYAQGLISLGGYWDNYWPVSVFNNLICPALSSPNSIVRSLPDSAVAQDIAKYSWMDMGATQQSNSTRTERLYYSNGVTEEPSAANNQTDSMTERFFIISYDASMCGGNITLDACKNFGSCPNSDNGFNILGKKAYAAQRTIGRTPHDKGTQGTGNLRLTEMTRATNLNAAGLGSDGKMRVKMSVVPKFLQDEIYVAVPSAIQYYPVYAQYATRNYITGVYFTSGNVSLHLGGSSVTNSYAYSYNDKTDINPAEPGSKYASAIASTTMSVNDNIPIVNIPINTYYAHWQDCASIPFDGSICYAEVYDIYYKRKAISIDGRVGDGTWHYYSRSWAGIIADIANFAASLINNLANNLSLNLIHLNISGFKGAGPMMPSFSSLSFVGQGLMLNSFAKDVIDKYIGAAIIIPTSYNLDFLGTVSGSIVYPAAYFGVPGGSSGTGWDWHGKFMEQPNVKLTASSTTAELPDKIGLSWTATNSDSCTASGDWSGVKATSTGSESFIKPKGDYTFGISCSNAIGTATSSARVAVTRVPRCDFSATSLPPPEFSTLKWDCTYTDPDAAKLYNSSADTCLLDGKSVSNIKDSIQKRPSVTTTYNLTCTSDISKTYYAIISIGAPTSTSGGTVKEIKP